MTYKNILPCHLHSIDKTWFSHKVGKSPIKLHPKNRKHRIHYLYLNINEDLICIALHDFNSMLDTI